MGYERCWIFGDDFASKSFQQHFQSRQSTDYNGYIKAHFNTTGFFNNFMADNPSVISRMANLLTFALSKKCDGKLLPLPRIIVVVPDNDLLRTMDGYTNELAKPFCRILNFIMTEYSRAVASYKENLPAKCVRTDSPQFLWIQLPSHVNFRDNDIRYKFNKCLEEVAKMHQNVTTLVLKKVWDRKDCQLYLQSNKFSFDGYRACWEAVDKTVRCFHSVVLKKHDKRKTQRLNVSNSLDASHGQKDQFRWQNPALNYDEFQPRIQFKKLPPPPSRQKSYKHQWSPMHMHVLCL